MSSKNIHTLTKQTYIEKNEQRLLSMSDAYFYKKHFLLGEGVDRDEMNFSTIMNSFLCERNCELNDLINDKIAGKLEPIKAQNKKTPKKQKEKGEVKIITKDFWDADVQW